jgi:group I intron endonuclease
MKDDQLIMYVYLITNKLDNRKYTGSRITRSIQGIEENYWGSSKYLKEDIKNLGKENFKKEIIGIYDNEEDLLEHEVQCIKDYNTMWPNGYNRCIPYTKRKFLGKPKSEEHKRKISKKLKGRKISPESIEQGLKTKREYSKKAKERLSKKISKAKKGQPSSNKGKKMSEEQKEKIRKSLKERHQRLKLQENNSVTPN